jgi:hypothetical protein
LRSRQCDPSPNYFSQQGYKRFALSETLQTLIDGQKASAQQINQPHQTVQTLIKKTAK